MLTDAWNEKREAEEDMKLAWLKENGYVSEAFQKKIQLQGGWGFKILSFNKSYDDSVKLKRTEMDPFRLC